MSKQQSPQQPEPHSTLAEIRATRLVKADKLRELGMNPYAYNWVSTHQAAALQLEYADLENTGEVDIQVSIAGRILARRVMGKLAFFSIQDETGTIQLYLNKQQIETGMSSIADAFTHLKQLTDIGDIIGVKGTIKRT